MNIYINACLDFWILLENLSHCAHVTHAEDWLKCMVLPQALNLLQPTHSQFTTWLHLGKLFYFAQGEAEETQKM